MKSIVIVVANGRVETVFSEEEVNVEIIDFDSCMCEEDESELADQVGREMSSQSTNADRARVQQVPARGGR